MPVPGAEGSSRFRRGSSAQRSHTEGPDAPFAASNTRIAVDDTDVSWITRGVQRSGEESPSRRA